MAPDRPTVRTRASAVAVLLVAGILLLPGLPAFGKAKLDNSAETESLAQTHSSGPAEQSNGNGPSTPPGQDKPAEEPEAPPEPSTPDPAPPEPPEEPPSESPAEPPSEPGDDGSSGQEPGDDAPAPDDSPAPDDTPTPDDTPATDETPAPDDESETPDDESPTPDDAPAPDDALTTPEGDDATDAEDAADGSATGARAIDPAAAKKTPVQSGSIKVNDSVNFFMPRNQPHPGCDFDIRLYGFDPAVVPTAAVTFTVHPPTGPFQTLIADVIPLSLPAGEKLKGNTLVGSDTYNLAAVLAPYTPHPIQGYHVKLTINTGDPKTNKHKVFWVRCAAVPPPPPPPPAPVGDLTITKTLSGDAPDAPTFEFTVTGPAGYSANVTLPTAGGEWTWTDEVPIGDYTVTEVATEGAELTYVSVDAGPPVETTSATVTVPNGATVSVSFTNVFAGPVVPPAPLVGQLTVEKAVAGADAPEDVSFEFQVTGPSGYDESFTLPTDDGSWSWTSPVPPGSYTVTELDNGGAETTVEVNGGPPEDVTSVVVTVLVNEETSAVFVNDFGDTDVGPIDEEREPPPPGRTGDVPRPPLASPLANTGIGLLAWLIAALLAMVGGAIAVRAGRQR